MILRNNLLRDLTVLVCSLMCIFSPGEAFISWSSISPALERAASYGYSMLGYSPPNYGYGDDLELFHKEPIWDGHINVGDVVSPILNALGSAYHSAQTDMYGNPIQDRVVKGFDNRFGFRIAFPYLGDFQVTREIGPGKYLDKLGPGKYPYSNLGPKSGGVFGKGHSSYGHGHSGYGHEAPHNSIKVVYKETEAPPADMYQSLQNYPWYTR